MGLNFSIPAYLSNFSTQDDKRTIAQLKVFYVGETGDGRVFDKNFSDELIKSLPYTPVVAFYSDLKDDFIGHNMKQYIYGIVTPDAKNGYVTDEDGVEWFTTEVMLYTDRIDNIGDVAKKIVGCAQSLEMDPGSVEYEVFKENGKTKVRFTKARLCGLSVLGSEQKPAFTGSEFFVENEDLRERFENFFSFLTNKDRGAQMDKEEILAQYVNFMKLTYGEKEKLVVDYAQEQYGESCWILVREMDDAHVVFEIFDYCDCTSKYVKYDYSISDQGVSLSNEKNCFMRFLTSEQIEKLEGVIPEDFTSQPEEKEEEPKDEKNETEEPADSPEDKEEDFVEEEEDEKVEEPEKEEDDEDFAKADEVDDEEKEDEKEEPTFTDDEGDTDEQKQEKLREEKDEENFAASAPELSNSEREELEAYRLKEKFSLIDSYKGDFDADTISSFKEKAQALSYGELEAKLAIKFREVSKNNIKNDAQVFSFSNVITTANTNAAKSYAELVRATLNK